WNALQSSLLARINLQSWLSSAASQLSSIGGFVFLIIIYIAFLFSERAEFTKKLTAAFPEPEKADKTRKILEAINYRVGQYLGTKTLINIILGVVAYLIMWAFDLDYAAFWALLIALLNYIPYVGSIIALFLPVALSVVQFASWPQTLGLYAGLQISQLVVANYFEPKLVGEKVNQSPVVVLVALSFWSTLWGVAGAILAVPMTSILMIIFGEIPATRPIAVFMCDDVKLFLKEEKHSPASDS
ncbi:MAG: AI-2E family transporter, partial [Actinobacteria bacterium]